MTLANLRAYSLTASLLLLPFGSKASRKIPLSYFTMPSRSLFAYDKRILCLNFLGLALTRRYKERRDPIAVSKTEGRRNRKEEISPTYPTQSL